MTVSQKAKDVLICLGGIALIVAFFASVMVLPVVLCAMSDRCAAVEMGGR